MWLFTVRARYDGVKDQLPAAYAELAGASHFEPVGAGGRYAGPLTAWSRWHLMDDTTARAVFVGTSCGLCGSSDWTQYEANALLEQQP